MDNRRLRTAWLIALTMFFTSQGNASISHCTPAQAPVFCNQRSESILLTQNDIDTMSLQASSAAWVIGDGSTISLPGGSSWTPGTANFNGQPTIWVIGSGTLEIIGDGSSEVGIDADIYLCDSATLRVKDSALRFEQDFSYEHWLWAADNSRVEYENAEIIAGKTGFNAILLHSLRGSSRLSNTTASAAVFSSSEGSIALEVVDAAIASIADSSFIVEAFLAGNSSLAISNSSYFNLSFTNCDGDSLSLADLPVACEIDNDCFTGAHPLTDFSRATAPALEIDDGKVFGWSVETFPNSSSQLQNIPVDANLQLILAGEMNPLSLKLAPFTAPTGITDRTITLDSANVFGWSLSTSGASDITLQQGSVISSLFSGDASQVLAQGTNLTNRVFVGQGTRLVLEDSTSDQPIVNQGEVASERSDIGQSPQILGNTWLADGTFPLTPSISEPGTLHGATLTAPQNSNILQGSLIEVRGTLFARDFAGEISPFPEAVLVLWDAQLMVTTPLSTITSEGSDFLLTELDTSNLQVGEYELRLSFSNSTNAVSVKTIQIVPELNFEDGFES